MLFKVAIQFAVVVVATLAMPVYEEHKEVEHHAPAHYQFKYGVVDGHTHDQKEQSETRDGDKVSGYYKLVEPDGTTRTVHYTADKHTGFHAQVVKSGHATHPIEHKKVEYPVKKVVIPVQYEPSYHQESSQGSGSSLGSGFSLGSGSSSGSGSSFSSDSFGSGSSLGSFGSSSGSSLGGSSSLGGDASSYSSFSI